MTRSVQSLVVWGTSQRCGGFDWLTNDCYDWIDGFPGRFKRLRGTIHQERIDRRYHQEIVAITIKHPGQ